MAKPQDLETRLIAVDDASKVIDKVADKYDDLEKKGDQAITIKAEDKASDPIDDLVQRLDKLSAEDKYVVIGARADEAQRDIDRLLRSLTQVETMDDEEINIRLRGLEEARGDLDKLNAELKAIEDVEPTLDTSSLRRSVNQVSDSARGANSALANMIGNTSQDLGAMAGLAGGAGVALGQMGEYAADAALGGEKLGASLVSMVKVAGPIAAITTAISIVSGIMGDIKAEAAAAAARMEKFGDEMEQSANDAVGLGRALKDSTAELKSFDAEIATQSGLTEEYLRTLGEKLPLLGSLFADGGEDVIDIMNRVGLSIFDLSAATADSEFRFGEFNAQLRAAVASGKITEAESDAILQVLDQMTLSYDDASAAAKVFNVDQRAANDLLDELAKKDRPLEFFRETWRTLLMDLRDGSVDTKKGADAINLLVEELGLAPEEILKLAKAERERRDAHVGAGKATDSATRSLLAKAKAQEDSLAADKAAAASAKEAARALKGYNQTLKGMEWGATEVDAAVTAMQSYTDQLNFLDNAQQAIVESQRELVKTLKDTGVNFDTATRSGARAQDAAEAFARTLDIKFIAAYDKANGNQAQFMENARKLGDEVLTDLAEKLGLSTEEVAALAEQLGLTEGDYKARFELSGIEEAKLKLDLLQGSIDLLPKNVQTQITQEIIEGDYQGALETVQDYYDRNPAYVDLIPLWQRPVGNMPEGLVGGLSAGTTAATTTLVVGPQAAPAPRTASVAVPFTLAAPSQTAAPTTINVVVQAAVIGGPFDVMRAVEDAMRRVARLQPVRP